MKIAFIVDPLHKLKAVKDSSIFMMREAAARGHDVYAFEAKDMWADSAKGVGSMPEGPILARCFRLLPSSDNDAWYRVTEECTMALNAFDAVLMRKDPPFNQEYLYSTLLLSLAESQGARVINRAASLRDYNEKLGILKFSAFVSPTLVTQDMANIHAFVDLHQDVILKKLDGMGGTSIFRVRADDVNRNAIIEVQTQYGGETVMAQRYIPAITQGDKRVLVIDGKPITHCLARIPKAGETRGNLAAGGRGVAQPISTRDREIAEALGPQLMRDGLMIVGLDIIGDYLTEVNVTSPTCMVEIFEQTGVNAATPLIAAIERGA